MRLFDTDSVWCQFGGAGQELSETPSLALQYCIMIHCPGCWLSVSVLVPLVLPRSDGSSPPNETIMDLIWSSSYASE